MRRRVLGGLLAVAVGACSSSGGGRSGDGALADRSADRSTAEGGATTPDGAPRDGASDASAIDGAPGDGSEPADGSLLDAALADPGQLRCGVATCALASEYCCDEHWTGGPVQCLTLPVSACGGLRRVCDETADCGDSDICCIPPNSAMMIGYSTECVAPTSGGECGHPFAYRICKLVGDCPAAAPCVTQICRGEQISTCGGIPSERCPK